MCNTETAAKKWGSGGTWTVPEVVAANDALAAENARLREALELASMALDEAASDERDDQAECKAKLAAIEARAALAVKS
jgi:regulator of replication initiation timing